jgi:16S rRNA U516 pseudouridylate synthase RsuA-like enzyme
MIIASVELISLPGAPAYQEKIYRAHMDTGEEVFLFQAHWDVPLPPESLVGLTIEEARKQRVERMLAAAGLH